MNGMSSVGSIYPQGNIRNGVDANTRNKVLDLSTSNREVLDLIQQRFSSENLSPLEQQELQYLFSVRQQKTSLISNLLRSLFDAISSVVRNFRV